MFISQFENYCISEGLSKARITKYILTLRKIAKMLEKNLDSSNRDDVESIINRLERSNSRTRSSEFYPKILITRAGLSRYLG